MFHFYRNPHAMSDLANDLSRNLTRSSRFVRGAVHIGCHIRDNVNPASSIGLREWSRVALNEQRKGSQAELCGNRGAPGILVAETHAGQGGTPGEGGAASARIARTF